MNKKLGLVFTILILCQSVYSQITPQGSWEYYLLQTEASENEIVIQWLAGNPALGDKIQGLSVLAQREDPDFTSIFVYLIQQSRNDLQTNSETVLAALLESAYSHCLRDNTWEFWNYNQAVLGQLLLGLEEWESTYLRSQILNFLSYADPSMATYVIKKETDSFVSILKQNKGLLPDSLILEATSFLKSSAVFNDPAITSLLTELYIQTKDPYLSRIMRELGIIKVF